MNFRTYEDLNRIINNNIDKIPNDVDLIVGVPKSGLMAASMIALQLNLPLSDIDLMMKDKILESGISKRRDNWIKKPSEARKILIVDDSSGSGITFKKTKEKVMNSQFADKSIILLVFVNEQTKDLPDMYLDLCPMPRMFEWNFMHHGLLEKACVDIDGVLCRDPSDEENDDGKKYKKFISSVKPRIVPTTKIGYLVTSRLEKYRKETEQWLKKNNIKYGELIMLDLPSKEERIRLGNHGQFKGENYKKLEDTIIFIESSEHQAQTIRDISGKSVYCTDNCKFYPSTGIIQNSEEQHTKKYRKIIRRIVPLKIRKIIMETKNKFLKN